MNTVSDVDAWTADICEVLGNRVGRCFSRVGMLTLADVKRAIEYHQLYDMSKGTYFFRGKDATQPHHAGPKAWSAVLEKLELLGFDWRAHIHRLKHERWYTTPTVEQQRAEIKQAIVELTEMLKLYLEATADV